MPGFYLPSENEYDPSTDDFFPPFVSKERRYKHFDLPLPKSEREQVINFSSEEKARRFLPLLGFTEQKRRYVRDAFGTRETKVKERPIRFAGHADSAYLQAYAHHLSGEYERALIADGTSGVVLAYRRGGGTNIHHAKALFDEIRCRSDCTVMAMDISGFFDCLNHRLLRDEVAGVLGSTRLDGHHATVWKNVTRYSWVETADLDVVLGRNRNGHGRVCSPMDFVETIRGRRGGLVQTHDQPFGIPQGTPVSGLYANIYLRSFDRELKALLGENAGEKVGRGSDGMSPLRAA
jgi:RNA-directed DNA polymerase